MLPGLCLIVVQVLYGDDDDDDGDGDRDSVMVADCA